MARALPVIRAGLPKDIPAIVSMGNRLVETQYANKTNANPVAMANTISEMILGGGVRSVIFVAEVDSKLVGMLGLVVYSHPVSGDKVASELFWWVEPEFRGSLGIRLLRQGERWVRAQKIKVLQMVAPSPAVEKIYEKLGFVRVEVSYQRELV